MNALLLLDFLLFSVLFFSPYALAHSPLVERHWDFYVEIQAEIATLRVYVDL